MPKDYKLKPGYRSNLVQATFDAEKAGTYWTAERRQAARWFQYYVYAFCRSHIRTRANSAVMDVGCGYPWKFAEMIHPYAGRQMLVDQASVKVWAKSLCQSADFLAVNLETIDLELPEKFDLIICADVIEHLIDPDPCLEFIRRHLAPAGLAVFSTPERDFLRGLGCDHCPKWEHVREWNSVEFETLLESRGFEIVERTWFPQKRITTVEYLLSRMVGPLRFSQRWATCQMVACRVVGRGNTDNTMQGGRVSR